MKRRILFPALVAGAAAAVVLARSGALAVSDETARRRHATPKSRYVEVDGVRMHYVDEGEGPVVLLLHGSYLNLHAWDAWAEALTDRFRVVRPDRPPFGLSGLDPANAYSYDREVALVKGFADALGLERFSLAGASSAGTVASRLAAQDPERIERLILLNYPFGGPRRINPPPAYRLARFLRDRVLLNLQPRCYTRAILRANLADRSAITPQLIGSLTDAANRRGALAAQRLYNTTAGQLGPEARLADARAIQAPTLVIWGGRNPLLSVEMAHEALAAIGAETKALAILPEASHMVPLEAAAESAAHARAFLLGQGWAEAQR